MATLFSLDDIVEFPDNGDTEAQVDRERARDRLLALISRKPMDQQIILLYLEDLSAEDMARLTGYSPAHIAIKIHRIKQLLAKLFRSGVTDD
jgi:DNA-directed RNA polymerase specialized sigma24 family protein